MDTALCLLKGMTEYRPVQLVNGTFPEDITEDDILDCRCVGCKNVAHLVHGDTRKLHFRAAHEETCDVVHDGRTHKVHKVSENTVVMDFGDIIRFKDHDPEPVGPGKPKGGPVDPPPFPPHNGEEENDNDDTIIKHGETCISTLKNIWRYINENGEDADLGNGFTGRDVILNDRALYEIRRDDTRINGIKIAMVKRISPSKMDPPIRIPEGYTLLCDAFSDESRLEGADFFLVKLKNAGHNEKFRRLVMGDKDDPSARNPCKNILILGNWKKVRNSRHRVCRAIVSSKCYHFLDLE